MRKLLVFFLLLISGIVIVWFYLGITLVDDIYGEEMFLYRKDIICHECLNGTRKEVCPKIHTSYDFEKIKYPSAKEFSGERSLRVDLSDFSDSNIIRNNICEYHHYEWMVSGTHDPYINKPEKSYSKSFPAALGLMVSPLLGPAVYVCAVLSGDCG